MSNTLTGDFDAVLQVSGGTVNRLLAAMHQNGFADLSRPSFPHSVQVPIGVQQSLDGVRGRALAQVGTPRIELIDGSTDRFWLEVDIRARYVPDAGTEPLPAYINGTIRAQYRVVGIDPNCLGWSKKKAGEYLWVRVVKRSVQFRGTTDEEPTPGYRCLSWSSPGSDGQNHSSSRGAPRHVVRGRPAPRVRPVPPGTPAQPGSGPGQLGCRVGRFDRAATRWA